MGQLQSNTSGWISQASKATPAASGSSSTNSSVIALAPGAKSPTGDGPNSTTVRVPCLRFSSIWTEQAVSAIAFSTMPENERLTGS